MSIRPLGRFEKPDKSTSLTLGIAFLLGVVTWYWLFRGKWHLGVYGEWEIIPGQDPWPRGAWGLPLAVLCVFGGFAALCAYDRYKRAKNRREQIASTRLSLLGIFLIALVWPWALLGPAGTGNLIASQWSDLSNEYFSTAYLIHDARQFTMEYAATRQEPDSILLAHVATHPPGAVLFYYGARRIYEALPPVQNVFSGLAVSLTAEPLANISSECNLLRSSASRSGGSKTDRPNLPQAAVGGALWSAFLISLCLALASPAVYIIASSREPNASEAEIVQAETRGMLAAALWALCPTANLFAFTLDAVIACGAVWTLAFLALRWRKAQPGWLLLPGAVMALTSFVSFGALAAGLILVLALALMHYNEGKLHTKLFVRDMSVCAVGFLLSWIFIVAIVPFSPVHVFAQAMAAHQFATVSVRDRFRGAWTWINVVTFALFCGWPLFVAATTGLRLALQKSSRGGNEPGQATSIRFSLGVGVAGVIALVLLVISGKALGEVERLWMFFVPTLAILAACGLTRRPNVLVIGTLLVFQASQTLLMAAWLWPIVRPL